MIGRIVLRPARPEDDTEVGRLMYTTVDEFDWLPRARDAAEDLGWAGLMIASGWVTVAEQEGTFCGFLAREDSYLHALYVAPTHRRKGVGLALLARAMAETGELTLWTHVQNHAARAFYTRAGFADLGEFDGSDTDEKMPVIRFRWRKEEGRQA